MCLDILQATYQTWQLVMLRFQVDMCMQGGSSPTQYVLKCVWHAMQVNTNVPCLRQSLQLLRKWIQLAQMSYSTSTLSVRLCDELSYM